MHVTPSIFKAYDIRGVVPSTLDEAVAEGIVAGMLDRGEVDMAAAQLEIEHFWAGALRRAVIEGDVENGSVMAGQSVGMVKSEESVQHILDTLMAEAQAALSGR